MNYAAVLLYMMTVFAMPHPDLPSDVQRLAVKAERGDMRAQRNLAEGYVWARGVPQDYAEAIKWYRRAADQGDAEALSRLGFVYLRGLYGEPQDLQQAYFWNSLAASRSGDPDLMARRDYAAGQLTPGQLAEAQDMVRDWKQKRRRS